MRTKDDLKLIKLITSDQDLFQEALTKGLNLHYLW